MLKLNSKVLSKCHPVEDGGYKRVFFIGLGLHKELTEDRLRQVFAAVGKELASMKAASAAIWTAPFTNDKLTCEDVVFAATEGIGLGMYKFEGYRTDSNERDVALETLIILIFI